MRDTARSQSARRSTTGQAGDGVWILLMAWFCYGAGAALCLSALLGLLQPILGSTQAARGAILAAMLAGLWAGSRLGRGRENPATYLIVSALGVLGAPWVYRALGPVTGAVQGAVLDLQPLLFLLRFFLALLLVIVPTACLGAAFSAPWLGLQGVSAGRRGVALRDAVLGAGATVGLVQGAFRILHWQGQTGVALAAALVLFLAALMGGILKRKSGSEAGAPAAGRGLGASIPGLVWGISAAAALLAWQRFLAPVLGPSTETSSRVVGLFLAGVSVGSLLVSFKTPLLTTALPLRPVLAGLTGVLLTGMAYFSDRLSLIYLSFFPYAQTDPLVFELGVWGLTALLVFPPALGWGVWLPWLRDPEPSPGTAPARGRPGGGEMDGALAGSFLMIGLGSAWLLPQFGFRTLLLGSSALLLGFFVVAWILAARLRLWLRLAGSLLGMSATLVPALLPPPGDPRFLSLGAYRYAGAILEQHGDPLAYRQARREATVSFFDEGRESVVAVEETPVEDDLLLSLTRDGVAIGSSTLDLVPQILSAEIPLLLKPSIREVFQIGYGTGLTAGSLLLHSLSRVHLVESEPAVVEASRQFEPANRSPRSDSRLTLHFEDPRQVLWSRPAGSLDLILSLGDAPDAAASRFLHTVEFYRLCASRLRPDGLYVEEIPLQGLSPWELATLLKTMRDGFTDLVLFQPYYQHWLALASQEPIRFDLGEMRQAMEDEKVASDLIRIGVGEPGAILIRHRLSGRGMEAFLRPGGLLTDTGPPLLWSGFAPGVELQAEEVLGAVDRFSTGLPDRIDGVEAGEEGGGEILRMARLALRAGDAVRAADLAENLQVRNREADAHRVLGEAHLLRGEQSAGIDELHKALEIQPDHLETLVILARYQVRRQNYEGAEGYLSRALQVDPENASLQFSFGQTLYHLGKFEDSEKQLTQVLATKGDEEAPLTLYYLGLIKKDKKQWRAAAEYLERYLQWAYRRGRLTAVEADAHLSLADVYVSLNRPEEADEQKKSGEVLRERLQTIAEAQQKELINALERP